MIIGTLLKIEAIKTGKRLAFIISWISMAFLATTIFYEPYAITKRVRGNSSFSFPDAWGILLSEEMMIPMFFGCIAIIIVTTAEFSSRTARQNVIDGLSKEQFFLSKTLLAFLICLLFAGTYLAIGASFAAAVTDFS
ncbi:MAG: hypothetical protein OEY63_07245, partial [Gemmatimonadota bacterium]|nr:hypothetical protein [Gemmatimonadota bacterium]